MQNTVFDITTIQTISWCKTKYCNKNNSLSKFVAELKKKEVKSNNGHGRSCDTVHI